MKIESKAKESINVSYTAKFIPTARKTVCNSYGKKKLTKNVSEINKSR